MSSFHETPMKHLKLALCSAVTSGLLLAALAPGDAVAASGSNALVRVEVIDHGAGTRTRASRAVGWAETASIDLELSGHAHALAITPHLVGQGVSLDFDHRRDGTVVADDLRLGSAERRVVVDDADTTVVITVVSVKTSVAVQ